MKIIGIIENNSITGVKYGEIEVPEEKQSKALNEFHQKKALINNNKKVRAERTKKK